jgi:hypothetical protein
MQCAAVAATHILFDYSYMIELLLPMSKPEQTGPDS